MIKKIKVVPVVLLESFRLLERSNPLILASSTAFFTTFSLSPIIIILVNVLSLYFKAERIRSELIKKITSILGEASAHEIEKIVNNFMSFKGSGWMTVVGFIVLIFIATTLLRVIQLSIHQLWHIAKNSSTPIQYSLTERMKAILMILFMGLLFLVSLLLDTSMALLKDYMPALIPSADILLVQTSNIVFSLVVITAWFSVLFKLLPDAHVHWRVAASGGFLTAVLFSLGKWVLGLFLVSNHAFASIFGASTSFALILLFIFYSSFIIYFGASFTYLYGNATGRPITPGKYGMQYEEKMIETTEE
jgi:membrane protein